MARTGVPNIRRSILELEKHPRACSIGHLKHYAEMSSRPIAVDLFCGAGGLSLGLQEAGFEIVLGVDKDRHAIATHKSYFGGASIAGDLSQPDLIEKTIKSLEGIPVSLVAGGPPCQPFSRAGKHKILSLFKQGIWTEDNRRELWRAFMDIVAGVRPSAVLMENVPDLALGENAEIFRRIVDALESAGYDVYARILASSEFGIPQYRQRLFIAGLKSGIPFKWPEPLVKSPPNLREAIGDLPSVEGGSTELKIPYHGPLTDYQRYCREGERQSDGNLIFDHIARAVRTDDLEAFQLMNHKTRYSDLPPHLRRYRSDIFQDKYKRLSWEGLSRTITAHMAHDSYWYIHPDQNRTLTIREAARIQSFPDWFRFAGPFSSSYRQIGEAVPPLLAKVLGETFFKSITGSVKNDPPEPTNRIAEKLRNWLSVSNESEMAAPWRRTRSSWRIILGILLFENSGPKLKAKSWATFNNRWPTPSAFLQDRMNDIGLKVLGVSDKKELLIYIASRLLASKTGVDPNKLLMGGYHRRRYKLHWRYAE
jgi:DNA (cytosine-5)-methyltransferase 1